jgi:hypothetical protein
MIFFTPYIPVECLAIFCKEAALCLKAKMAASAFISPCL